MKTPLSNQITFATNNLYGAIHSIFEDIATEVAIDFYKSKRNKNVDFYIDCWRRSEALRQTQINARNISSTSDLALYELSVCKIEEDLQNLTKVGVFALYDATMACLINLGHDYGIESVYALDHEALGLITMKPLKIDGSTLIEGRRITSLLWLKDPLGILLEGSSSFLEAANVLAHYCYLQCVPFREEPTIARVMLDMAWVVTHTSVSLGKDNGTDSLLKAFCAYSPKWTQISITLAAQRPTGYDKCTQMQIRYSCGCSRDGEFFKCKAHREEHQVCAIADIQFKDLKMSTSYCKTCLHKKQTGELKQRELELSTQKRREYELSIQKRKEVLPTPSSNSAKSEQSSGNNIRLRKEFGVREDKATYPMQPPLKLDYNMWS